MEKSVEPKRKNKLLAQRNCGDKTRSDILKAATTLFAKKGFAGTAISEIATKAKINQSLIYHHFGSKKGLWREMRFAIANSYFNAHNFIPFAGASLKQFLTQFVQSRVDFYKANPEVLRIVRWQQLESIQEKFHSPNPSHLANWNLALTQLKQNGELRANIDPNLFRVMVVNIVYAAFDEQNLALCDDFTKAQNAYLDFIIDCLERALKP